MPTCPFFTLC